MKNWMKKKTDTKENKINRIDYRAMYYSLFQDVTDAVKVLECVKDDHVKEAVRILESAQCKTEEIYIQQGKHILHETQRVEPQRR